MRFLIRPSFIRYRSTARLRRTSAFLSAGQFCLRVWRVSDTKRTIDVAIKRAAEAVAAHELDGALAKQGRKHSNESTAIAESKIGHERFLRARTGPHCSEAHTTPFF